MQILIETPTWLGDTVMATPAVENVIRHYPNANITIFGTKIASGVFAEHPQVKNIIIDNSRVAKNRYWWLYKQAKQLKFDIVFSFRRQFSAKFFVYFISANNCYYYKRYDKKIKHQVLRYNDFINYSLGANFKAGNLKIYRSATDKTCEKKHKKILGLNPGASYGSAKRWYPTEFAIVASELAKDYNIEIFSGAGEVDIAGDIAKLLAQNGIKNYQNLAGKTSIDELIDRIAGLDLFITGDSGPMHIAAAFAVPTVAIFGPTEDGETSQWGNAKSVVLKQQFDCQPCMRRRCPLTGDKHHRCMKTIKAGRVLASIKTILPPKQ